MTIWQLFSCDYQLFIPFNEGKISGHYSSESMCMVSMELLLYTIPEWICTMYMTVLDFFVLLIFLSTGAMQAL